jgi:hypothetical protein
MTTREELRRDAGAMRARLFGAEPPPDAEPAAAVADLVNEVTFGAVWSCPGLGLSDRMIATLAALCAVQRLYRRAEQPAQFAWGPEDRLRRRLCRPHGETGRRLAFPLSQDRPLHPRLKMGGSASDRFLG